MNNDLSKILRSIASDLNNSRNDLLRFCDANDGDPNDFDKLGDGSPGTAMHTLDTIIDGLKDMDAKFRVLSPPSGPHLAAPN